MLRYNVSDDPSSFLELAKEWASLLERSSSNEATVAPFWQSTWWSVFGGVDGRRLRLVTFREGERLVGVAPLLWRRHWYRPGIPLRRLELVASGEPREDEICSDYNGLIVERGREAEVARCFAELLFEAELGAWDELVLPALSGDDALVDLLANALREHGHAVTVEESAQSKYVPLPGTWDAYLASLSGATRHMVRKTLRDLDTWAGGDVSFERVRNHDEVDRGFEIISTLHAQRWEATASGYGGVFASGAFRSFHKKLMHDLIEHDALDLCWLSARGEPIAALYNFVWNNKVYHYQSGRRVDLPKQIRPGIAAHAHAIRAAIEHGRREYDFLPGEERYKDQLALSQRTLVELRATNRPVVEMARQVARRGLNGARAMQRSLFDMARRHSPFPGTQHTT